MFPVIQLNQNYVNPLSYLFNGQSYKHSVIVNYDTSVIAYILTLES